jgi:hypothetical protein
LEIRGEQKSTEGHLLSTEGEKNECHTISIRFHPLSKAATYKSYPVGTVSDILVY